MLLYLDTSALVKLHVEEAHSAMVTALHRQAQVIATRVNLFSARKKPIHRRGRGGKPSCSSSASSAVKKVLSLWIAVMSRAALR